MTSLPIPSSTDQTISPHERRDSIDMPNIEDSHSQRLDERKRRNEAEMEGTASVVSDDLELTDDEGKSTSSSSSSSDGGSSSSESSNENSSTSKNSTSNPRIKSKTKDVANKKSGSGSSNGTQASTTMESKSFEGSSVKQLFSKEESKVTSRKNEASDKNEPTTTTEDSDSSAKSGMENDSDDFKSTATAELIEGEEGKNTYPNLEDDSKRECGNSTTNDDKTSKVEDDLLHVEDTDDYLMYLEDTLKAIHKAYYEAYDKEQALGFKDKTPPPDLKQVIPSVKKQALKGTSIVFSGVIPTHIMLERSKPYLVAISLGAQVTDRITKCTTHLVAARTGTAKVNEARKRAKNVHLVTPDWLWCCAERWERIDER